MMRRCTVMFALVIGLGLAAAPPALAGVSGWRGDGSGRYPDAKPPVKWSRKSKRMLGLTCQSAKPGGAKGACDLSDGVVREWLVLGPFDAKGAKKKQPFANFSLGNEAALSPSAGDKTSGKTWKKFATGGSFIEPKLVFGTDMVQKAGCFFTNVHSKSGGAIYLCTKTRSWNKDNAVELWVNGVKAKANPPVVTFKAGWNRLLVKVISTTTKPDKPDGKDRQPNFGLMLWGDKSKNDAVSENILWQTRLPQDLGAWRKAWSIFSSASQPVIIGDRVFATAEPQTLICMDKHTGGILWTRSDNYADLATAEERVAKADLFAKIDPLNKRIKAIDQRGRLQTPAEMTEKAKAEKEVLGLMRKVAPKKYYRFKNQEGGLSAATPITDGERVYVNYGGTGMTVCYDIDGSRKWTHHLPSPPAHHCYAASPCIVNGRIFIIGGQNGDEYKGTRTVVSIDCKTGKEVTKEDIGRANINSSFIAGKIAGKDVIAFEGLIDPATGKRLCRVGHGIPSPIFIGEKLFLVGGQWNRWSKTIFSILEFPGGNLTSPKVTKIPFATEDEYLKHLNRLNDSLSLMCSPVYHEGLVYFARPDGLMFVVDVAKGQVVYTRYLKSNWWTDRQRGQDSASMTLAGKYIYYFDIAGTCIVFEPGRTYKEVARNRIEQTTPSGYINNFKSTPIFEGNRIYFKAEDYLYCIGTRVRGAAAPSAEASPVASKPKAARPKAAPRPLRKLTDEQRAKGLLSGAENYIRAGMGALARKKLSEIVEKYPETAAAGAAEKKLAKLGGDE